MGREKKPVVGLCRNTTDYVKMVVFLYDFIYLLLKEPEGVLNSYKCLQKKRYKIEIQIRI